MSYPQPDSNVACTSGLNFFRFTSELTSPGDMYESDQGGYAFAIGPDSDIANVAIAYFNDQEATRMSQVQIGPERALVGRVFARNDSDYLPANRPGKILFWSADQYVPNYQPVGFDIATDTLVVIPPVLDLIQYFTTQESLTPKRIDKTYTFQSFQQSIFPNGELYLCVPFYGRNFAYINFTNRNGAAVDYTIRGVNFTTTPPANQEMQETTILATAAIADNASSTVIVNASVTGQFDYLVFVLEPAVVGGTILADLKIVTSDIAKG